MPKPQDSTSWQLGDDPLANLPGPVGTNVAQWRRQGFSDEKIRSLLNSSWLKQPPPSWQPGLSELSRRDAAAREHEAAGGRRFSDTLDAAFTSPEQPDTYASPQETPSEPPAAELQDATNEQIDAMLRRLWEQRANKARGLSRDKEAMRQWKQALAEQGLTSTWRMVRTRHDHDDNKHLRGPRGAH